MDHSAWLLVVGGIPTVGSIAVAALPRERELLAKQVALVAALATLAVTIAMSVNFNTGGSRYQFRFTADWIPQFGVHFALGADGVALVLIGLTAVLMPVVVLASWHDAEAGERSVRLFFSLLLATEALLVGVFAALDVFTFYVFFEASLVPMYFLIGSYGGARRSYAAVKFLLYSLLGGLLMLAAVIGLFVISARTGHGTFLLDQLTGLQGRMGPVVENSLFLGFFIAFAIKAPLWPFHTWLPDAAAEAPAGVAVLLVGVLDKIGTFGMLRYCLQLFPDASRTFAPYILALAIVGILYGALLAIGQRDLKRLVAYTSVSHFGFIALGVFALTSQGQSGASFYMVNHGFSTGALFLLVGFLIARRGSDRIADYSGVHNVAPWLAGSFVIAGLSSLALPGLSTFISEFLVLVGTFTRNKVYGVLGTIGIILAAVYILLVIQRTMHGPLSEANRGLADLNQREAWVIAPVLALIVFLGVYPKPVLDVINPAVRDTLKTAHQNDPRPSDVHAIPASATASTGVSK